MKLMDIYFSLKSDLDMVERRLHDEVHTSQYNLKKASAHLLKAGGSGFVRSSSCSPGSLGATMSPS
ncbi:hypothetical protein [Tumebacillus avium]|uniref:hypothetical protein n=1 Tax=Tumebacillus avium TaxID=1903704 RepID=UPI0026AA9D12